MGRVGTEKEEQETEEGASRPFNSESGIPGYCQGWSLDKILTLCTLEVEIAALQKCLCNLSNWENLSTFLKLFCFSKESLKEADNIRGPRGVIRHCGV